MKSATFSFQLRMDLRCTCATSLTLFVVESPARFKNFFNWRDGQETGSAVVQSHFRSDDPENKSLSLVSRSTRRSRVLAAGAGGPDLCTHFRSTVAGRGKIDLFMTSLYEAIALVVIIALIGFWEWRSALLMAISIPVTLAAVTFGMMHVLGIDLQQVSIATLIIALGLLVDDLL